MVAIRRRKLLFVLAEARLNFVNDAEIADEFGAPRVHEVGLTIETTIDGGGLQIGETRFAPGKS